MGSGRSHKRRGRRLLVWVLAVAVAAAWRQSQVAANERRYGDTHRPRPRSSG